MTRLASLLAAASLALTLFPASATAQTTSAAPPPPPGASTSPSTTTETPGALPPMQVTANACPSDYLYQQAFQRFAEGHYDEVEPLVTRVLHDCPNHPFAGELLHQTRIRIGLGMHNAPPAGGAAAPTDEETRRQHALYGPEDPGTLARPELVIVQALHGAYQGTWLCLGIGDAIGNSCSPAAGVASGLIGAGVFGGAAFLATNRRLRPGQATVVDSGSLWGIVNGGLLLTFANSPSLGAMSLAFAGGGLVGTGAGALVAVYAPPTAGQVGMANSLALWTGGIAGLMLAEGGIVAGRNMGGVSGPVIGGVLLAAIDGGLVIGGVVGSRYRVTRGRMLIADLGAVLGGVLGGGVGTLISLATNLPDPALIGGAIGIGGGFVTALLLTHNTDYPHPRVQTSIVPIGPYGSPGMTATLRF